MKRQKLLAGVITIIFVLFIGFRVQADNDLSDDIAAGQQELDEAQQLYDEMQAKIDELEENKENLSAYLAKLNESYSAAQSLVDNYDTQIAQKQTEIDAINLKLEAAKVQQNEQYEAMKLRIQYMYESEDMDIVNVLMSDGTLGEILNRVEYIEELVAYDRSKMEEYENLLLTITVMQKQAETEMQELEALRTEQQGVMSEMSVLMADASENIKNHQDQISQAEEEALKYEEEIEKKKNDIELLKQEESRRIAESEEASRRQAAIERGELTEETTAAYVAEANDLQRLAAIIYCEAGGEPYEGQLAVGTVVMNRVASSKYADTIEGVLTQPYQFTPVGSGRYAIALAKEPDPSCLKAATEVLIDGVRTGPWLYFRTVNNIVQGTIIGNHVFY